MDGERKFEIDIMGYVDAIPMGVLKVNDRKINLGTIVAGTPAPFQIRVYNAGNAAMEITRLVSKKHGTVYFDAKKSGKIIVAPEETQIINSFVTSHKKGRFMDFIMIHSNARNVTDKGYKVVVKGNIQ